MALAALAASKYEPGGALNAFDWVASALGCPADGHNALAIRSSPWLGLARSARWTVTSEDPTLKRPGQGHACSCATLLSRRSVRRFPFGVAPLPPRPAGDACVHGRVHGSAVRTFELVRVQKRLEFGQ